MQRASACLTDDAGRPRRRPAMRVPTGPEVVRRSQYRMSSTAGRVPVVARVRYQYAESFQVRSKVP